MQRLPGNTIAAPQQPSDYHGVEYLPGPNGGHLTADIWWESESAGTRMHVLSSTADSPQVGDYPSLPHRWAYNVLQFSQAGLEPVLREIGFTAEAQPSTEQTGYTDYWLRVTPTSELIERANNYRYPSHIGRRMRFDHFYRELYTLPEYFEAMAEGRMLIPVVGQQPWVKFHDIGDHMIVGLALSSELVDALAQRARHILDTPQLMAQLRNTDDLENNFFGLYDVGLFSTNFLRFLHEDETELKRWSKILDIDVEAARGYAIRARDELQEIGASDQHARPAEAGTIYQARRRQTRLGSLLRRWLPLPR